MQIPLSESGENVAEIPEFGRNRMGVKNHRRYLLYMDLENGKSMWHEKSIMHERKMRES